MVTDQRVAQDARWISVVFVKGWEADEAFEIMADEGPAAALEHLEQSDLGEDTVNAALANGYVYDRIPVGPTDRTVVHRDVGYAMTYSEQFRHISVFRRYRPPATTLASEPQVSRRDLAAPWSPDRTRSTVSPGRTVAL
jgi:hypothetical protein